MQFCQLYQEKDNYIYMCEKKPLNDLSVFLCGFSRSLLSTNTKSVCLNTTIPSILPFLIRLYIYSNSTAVQGIYRISFRATGILFEIASVRESFQLLKIEVIFINHQWTFRDKPGKSDWVISLEAKAKQNFINIRLD